MHPRLQIGDLAIDLVLKEMRGIRLSVHPPAGTVRIAAPKRMSLETIRRFAESRLDWIHKQQARLRSKAPADTPVDYRDGESLVMWGKPCALAVIEEAGRPTVELAGDRLVLRVPPDSTLEGRRALVEAWSRGHLREAVIPLLSQWEPVMGVKAKRLFVRRMKTKWGSCNHRAKTIRLNTELVGRPPACLEYVVVHELAHLLEPTHNARFVALMDRFLPGWRLRRSTLRET